jgi:hypothetical protein
MGKLSRIALIIEDRGLQRCLYLGQNPRSDGGAKMAKKQCFHTAHPSSISDESAILGASANRGKEFGSRLLPRKRHSTACHNHAAALISVTPK